ncbi:Replicase polyprotein 1a [Zea mays]|uniref:Replicase polyprotein 1a n=1 Tax=Zea mays TaxID=4577 RepID=A0A3L6FER8_MAIZE|nr:Replicase polyprotein 1a [Zea mays]
MRLAHFCMLGSANASAGCLVCMASNLTSQCLYWHRQISWLSGLGPSNKQSRRCEVSSRLGWIIVKFQPGPWAALSSIAVVLDDSAGNEERAKLLAPGASDFLLDLRPPLDGASYLVLPKRLVQDSKWFSFPCVISACSDRLLFLVSRGDQDRNYAYFLGDAHAGTAALLPDVPAHLGVETNFPRRSIGLIADPRHGGHYMVAHLYPTSTTRHQTLLCYSTVTDQWTARPLVSAPDHPPWGAHGVLAHGGLLWWIDVAYGMLVCNPFAADDGLRLRFIPLPLGCQMKALTGRARLFLEDMMDRRRIIRLSQGKLRYVAIQVQRIPKDQATVCMFTLVLRQGGQHSWEHEYTVTFADIWSHRSYADARLPSGVVPSLAFVDPNNPNILYFFLDKTLFALDAQARQVLHHMEYSLDPDYYGQLRVRYSCFVDAWVLPPTLLRKGDSRWTYDDDEGTDGSDFDQTTSLLSLMEIKSQLDDEGTDGSDFDQTTSLLSLMEIKSQLDDEGTDGSDFDQTTSLLSQMEIKSQSDREQTTAADVAAADSDEQANREQTKAADVPAADSGEQANREQMTAADVPTADSDEQDDQAADCDEQANREQTTAADSGEQDVPAADSGEQDIPAADSGDQDVPAADSGEQANREQTTAAVVPAADSGEQDVPAADSGEQDLPAADSGEQDIPAADSGEQDVPAPDSGEQAKREQTTAADVPDVDSGEHDVPAADSGEQANMEQTTAADVPAADSGEQDIPAAVSGEQANREQTTAADIPAADSGEQDILAADSGEQANREQTTTVDVPPADSGEQDVLAAYSDEQDIRAADFGEQANREQTMAVDVPAADSGEQANREQTTAADVLAADSDEEADDEP